VNPYSGIQHLEFIILSHGTAGECSIKSSKKEHHEPTRLRNAPILVSRNNTSQLHICTEITDRSIRLSRLTKYCSVRITPIPPLIMSALWTLVVPSYSNGNTSLCLDVSVAQDLRKFLLLQIGTVTYSCCSMNLQYYCFLIPSFPVDELHER
jgi:hypothetical protein